MNETIRLGGRDFALRPLTLGQLRHLLDALDAMAGTSGGALIDAAARLVAAGLAATHPEFTAASVLDCTASLAELNAAVAAILQMAGLSPQESRAESGQELGPGEARPVASLRELPRAMAGEAPAPSSAPSTAPSPPAAATPGL
jgi:hypothetical protein